MFLFGTPLHVVPDGPQLTASILNDMSPESLEFLGGLLKKLPIFPVVGTKSLRRINEPNMLPFFCSLDTAENLAGDPGLEAAKLIIPLVDIDLLMSGNDAVHSQDKLKKAMVFAGVGEMAVLDDVEQSVKMAYRNADPVLNNPEAYWVIR